MLNLQPWRLIYRSACGSTPRITLIALALALGLSAVLVSETSRANPYDFELVRDNGVFEIAPLSDVDEQPDWQLLEFRHYDINSRRQIRFITKCTFVWLGEDVTSVVRGEERRFVTTDRDDLKILEQCLNPDFALKPVVELNPHDQEGHSANPFVGQLIIETNIGFKATDKGLFESDKTRYTIGVIRNQFSLETQNSPRFYFHSVSLAGFCKRLLADEMDHVLSKETLNRLNGKRILREASGSTP